VQDVYDDITLSIESVSARGTTLDRAPWSPRNQAQLIV
jgi:hypothetical protein